MIYKIDHIGVAVKSIEKSLNFYSSSLGISCKDTEYIKNQGVKVAFLPLGESEIELLEAVGDSSPVAKFIDKRGEGIHHVAFRVSSVMEEMEKLKKLGIEFIGSCPSYGAGAAKIVFIHPSATGGVLIELCER